MTNDPRNQDKPNQNRPDADRQRPAQQPGQGGFQGGKEKPLDDRKDKPGMGSDIKK